MKHDAFENIEIKILNVLKKFKYKLIQFLFYNIFMAYNLFKNSKY